MSVSSESTCHGSSGLGLSRRARDLIVLAAGYLAAVAHRQTLVLGLRRGRRAAALRLGVGVALLLVAALPPALLGVQARLDALERARYLYYPPDWEAVATLEPGPSVSREPLAEPLGMGGTPAQALPLRIMVYAARSGDTLSGIALSFGLELDTVASLNREWGRGVHLVTVGEKIQIPNQDGIYLPVDGSTAALEAACQRYGLDPEMVLAVNGVNAKDLGDRRELFFPSVQHSGAEREIVEGRAFMYPVSGYISSRYGYRTDPFTQQWRFHRGLDIAAPQGAVVRSAGDGIVESVYEDEVLGKQIVIRHAAGFRTLYGHLLSIVARRGQTVTSQTVIGYVGATGRATGPHLHFEIRLNGIAIDPLVRLAPRRY